MSTFGIKKGERRFKPKPSNTPRVKKRLRKETETNEEQQTEKVEEELNQDTNDFLIYNNDTFESTIPTRIESSPTPPSPSAPSIPSPLRLPIVPLSQDLIRSTLNDYTSNTKKRKRAHGHSKEQLILMAQEEQEERERQEAKQQEHAEKISTIPIPQVKLINGEIVVDETSFHAPSEQEQETEEGVDDNNNKKVEKQVVDESSFIQMQRGSKLQQSKRWTIEETELFYELLKELGLDFTTISTRVPGRTQEQIRRKYYQEYKRYPSKIDKLLQN